jgi:hypothetical protein
VGKRTHERDPLGQRAGRQKEKGGVVVGIRRREDEEADSGVGKWELACIGLLLFVSSGIQFRVTVRIHVCAVRSDFSLTATRIGSNHFSTLSVTLWPSCVHVTLLALKMWNECSRDAPTIGP